MLKSYLVGLCAAGTLLVCCGRSATAAYTISGTNSEGTTTDLLDISQGGSASATSAHTPCCSVGQGPSTAGAAIGATDSFVEPTHFIFDDNQVGTDTLFITPGKTFNLNSYVIILQSDPGGYRGASSFSLLAGPSFTNLSVVDSGLLAPSGDYSTLSSSGGSTQIEISGTTSIANIAAVELQLTRATAGGPRVIEIDGFGNVPEPSNMLFLSGWVLLARRRRGAPER